jgi:L-lactate dehydrogenase complex protein LldG
MEESTSREKILKRVRDAQLNKPLASVKDLNWKTGVLNDMDESIDLHFVEEFKKASGQFEYCENEQIFSESFKILLENNNWTPFCFDQKIRKILSKYDIATLSDQKDFNTLQVGITRCEYLIARHGSIMVSAAQNSGRKLNIFPEVHVVLAYTSQLQAELKDALLAIRQKYNGTLPSMISIITGPSRTADIEKTLVMGAHGPKELYLFLIEDRSI